MELLGCTKASGHFIILMSKGESRLQKTQNIIKSKSINRFQIDKKSSYTDVRINMALKTHASEIIQHTQLQQCKNACVFLHELYYELKFVCA